PFAACLSRLPPPPLRCPPFPSTTLFRSIVREAEATREEEAALGFGVEIHRGGDIRHRLGVARPIGMRPDIDRPADEDVAAGRAAELHEPGDTTHAGAVDALVTLDVRRAIAQPETDPKAIASPRVLRPRGGRRAGERGEQCEDSRGVHGTLPSR